MDGRIVALFYDRWRVVEIAKLDIEIVDLWLVVLGAEVRRRPRDITLISLLYRELAWWAALLLVGRGICGGDPAQD
jgi:hypothetical protein